MKTFREAIQGECFTISADLSLRRESTADDILREADKLGKYVDGIQVTDNPYAWVQMSSLSAASILINHGIDPIPILTCRDRNRIALQSDLLGLRALGITSVLLIRGHKIPRVHNAPASMVFDLAGRDLIALASSLGEELSPGTGKEFFIGTGARVFRPDEDWRAGSLAARAAAGAHFIQTSPCFNMNVLRDYMNCVVAEKLTWRYSVVVTLSPLTSANTAKWLKQNMAGAQIPESLIQRLEETQDPEQEGIRICAELMQEVSEIPGISGVHLMTTGNSESILAAIEASGLRS